MKKIKFKLSLAERITFEGKYGDIEESFSCDDMVIKFENSDICLTLFSNFIFSGLDKFIFLLTKACGNDAYLHASIQQDLGYMWSRLLHCEDESGLVYENDFWVGQRNLLWSPTGSGKGICTSWLYNDKNGDIILEVTPSYRWHFDDPQVGDDYISYQEFMQNYKPLLFRKIHKEVAKEWLAQAKKLYDKIKANEQKAASNNCK